jgi:hypothetical protein
MSEYRPIPGEVIEALCLGSESQIDAELKPRLRELSDKSGQEVMDKLREIIREIVLYDLGSAFVLGALQIVYVGSGGKKEDVTPVIRCTPVT